MNLSCKRLQCDEIWCFVGAKERNIPVEGKGQGRGDVWTWTAICADTKIIPVWYIGNRDGAAAYHFMQDVVSRLSNRVQLTTDAHRPYLQAIEDAFGSEIDYAQLVKVYGRTLHEGPEIRYSTPACTEVRPTAICGKPKISHVSTSYVERQNLTMRMGMRRFTRLTNAFSKKIENLEHSVALYFMHYNFCRIHQTLRVTPAMQAGISDHVWTLEELIALIG